MGPGNKGLSKDGQNIQVNMIETIQKTIQVNMSVMKFLSNLVQSFNFVVMTPGN